MNGSKDNSVANPHQLFRQWYQEAEANEPGFADAMALATADAQGHPSVRMVLLKRADENGFVFYTNCESRKGAQIAENAEVALCFYWHAIERQVRIEGTAERVPDDEADAYFASRDRDSQVGAWASLQSQPLDSREALMERVAEFDEKYKGGDVPRPPHWSGYRVAPNRMEFWQQGEHRLHDRFCFERDGDGWTVTRLFP